MDTSKKPTFGAQLPEQNGTLQLDEIDLIRKQRPEIGAIWEQTSKTNIQYLTIRIKMPREMLLNALNSTSDDVIKLNFVAFKNKNLENNIKKPIYRVYQEIPKVKK